MRTSKLILGTLLSTALLGTAAVQAQSAPAPSREARMGQMREHQAQHREAMHARLHDTLKLNADQESAWKKFDEAMLPMARPERPANAAALTAPERADQMVALSRQHQASIEKRAAAVKEFYAVLSPEQKRAFDAFHAGMKGPGGSRGGHRGPGAPL